MDVSRETLEGLKTYEALIEKWNSKINLVSKGQDIWTRHILDSYQLAASIPEDARSLVDFGSGGGLPAIVLAIYAKAHQPELSFTLIESDHRKSAFLRTCIRELGLNGQVITERVESANPVASDVITARATASLSQLLEWTSIHGHRGSRAIFPKGERYQFEIDEAEEKWAFQCEKRSSSTNTSARILIITDLKMKSEADAVQ
ncbi:16S rRNA (guanine(527)-N(7))-methyltransferase RsmG [Nereida sp. MMG025]|uniref:16S rRNA (guanine(527)-N(7))-methyltransferase RsmG n=1 Tax=Nereida sp. MMG025 TaxID=2909981 RepID=UPI001F01DDFE|nr:16S rRNA (guanine(527)-N(7))-methyltransferase RsmG [Nereida sp. MMG025]MCF6444621.1 16S rRNA (guanine(527)-N(7))-methyltransferase RsmG [Nereida sp. MMG025]